MKVYLTTERKRKIKEACLQLFRQDKDTIRFVARVIGLMTASFPAVKYGPLHFRGLERCKSEGVKLSKGNYDVTIQLTSETKQEVQWWIDNIEPAYNDIYHDNPSLSLTTDASKVGWGATLASIRTGGLLSHEEAQEHINVLEVTAIFFAMKSLITQENIHVELLCDNTTAVYTVNNMGTSFPLVR